MKPADLKAWRERNGYSLRALALALSADPDAPPVDHMTIWKWEQGRAAWPAYLPLALERLEQ